MPVVVNIFIGFTWGPK